MTPETIAEVKKVMGYHDGDECCGNCQHFSVSQLTADEGDCEIQTFLIPVMRRGWCKHGTHIKEAP